jgi:HK97 family phage major capsid protein
MYLDRLLQQREDLRADAKNILDNAAAESRDVTDVEREAVEASYRSVDELDKQIDPLHKAELRQISHDQQVAELERASRARRQNDKDSLAVGGVLESYRGKPGEWLADWGAKNRDPAAAQRIMRAQAEYRVVADQKLADNPGIVPTPVIGPVGGVLPSLRPFIDSVANRPMPAGGSSFNRPSITQHATVALQATEKTQLSSQKLTITSVSVPKKTFGGTLDISFQDRDWTDPAILAIAVSDLQAVYANETDNAAADGALAATTGTFVLADAAAEGAARSAIMTASAQIFANVKQRPDTVWMSPDEYAKWGAMTTSVGLVSFPGINDATTTGGSLMGLRVVVDGNFAAKTMIIGVSSQFEHYETVGGLLAVTEPTILGYTIAYYGYVADLLLNVGAALKRSAT